MDSRRCEACQQIFHPRPQNPKQRYCSKASCQRERKRRWQESRRGLDPDYRGNQASAQRAWVERHSEVLARIPSFP